MKVEQNGKSSSSQWTCHLNIRYFFITDIIKSKEVSIEYCPTDKMVSDFLTKPLQGGKFIQFRDQILGMVPMVEHQFPHRSVLKIGNDCQIGSRNSKEPVTRKVIKRSLKENHKYPKKAESNDDAACYHTETANQI